MSISFSIALPPDRAAGAAAREAVRRHLAGVLPAPTLADLLLAVSELVANAVVHGRGEVELRIEFDGQAVKGEVIDRGGGLERRLRETGLQEVAGDGLAVVGRVADTWGVYQGTTHVWFEMPLGPADPAPAEPELGTPNQADLPDAK